MLCYLESGKRVGSNVECRHFDKLKKVVKIIRIEEDFGQGFIPGTLPQHCATVQCNLLMLVPERVMNCVNKNIGETKICNTLPLNQHEKNFWFRADVLNSG